MPHDRAVSLGPLGKKLTFSSYACKACGASPQLNAPEFLLNHSLALMHGSESSLYIHKCLRHCKSS